MTIMMFVLNYSFIFFEILGQTSMMESVPDLQSSMYMTLDGYPCVRLLNLSGVIGCASKYALFYF